MRRLPSLPARRVARALEKLGFEPMRTHGSHLIMRRREPYGRVTVPLHDTVALGTLKAILREGGVTEAEFLEALA